MQPVKISSTGRPVLNTPSGFVQPVYESNDDVEPVRIVSTGNAAPVVVSDNPSLTLPSSISNLTHWFDSIHALHTSTLVSTWDNRATGGDATQTVDTNKPQIIDNSLSGYPVLNYDGTDDRFAISVSLTGAFTISMVISADDITAGRMLIGAQSTTLKFGFLGGKYFVRLVSTADNAVNANPINDYHVLTLTRNSANKVDLYINDGAANRLFGDVAQVGTFAFDRIGRSDTGQFFDGKMAEMVIYTKELNLTERGTLVTYFNQRYNL